MGGYSACAFDLTALLKSGEENEILVRVDNSSRPDVTLSITVFSEYMAEFIVPFGWL